jgi:hypothetical protein
LGNLDGALADLEECLRLAPSEKLQDPFYVEARSSVEKLKTERAKLGRE